VLPEHRTRTARDTTLIVQGWPERGDSASAARHGARGGRL